MDELNKLITSLANSGLALKVERSPEEGIYHFTLMKVTLGSVAQIVDNSTIEGLMKALAGDTKKGV